MFLEWKTACGGFVGTHSENTFKSHVCLQTVHVVGNQLALCLTCQCMAGATPQKVEDSLHPEAHPGN